jgi:putative aldouronate transport system permease protein
MSISVIKQKRRGMTAANRQDNLYLWAMMIPVLILIFIFSYVPMYGILIAFQKYRPGKPFLGPSVRWVGLKHFADFIQSEYFFRILFNTIRLNLYQLVFGFTTPILFALLLDQITNSKYRKFVQTVSYMPHFISMVVVAGMVCSFITSDGLITQLLTKFGLPAQNYRLSSAAFTPIYTLTTVWKGFGWGSILYMATISGISPTLYEAAKLDGANRWQQVWHITLPGIKPVIAINLIMQIGGLLRSNSDLILLLYQPATYDVADVLGTYIYRMGIESGQYSLTTAAGLFMSLIGFILTFCSNKFSDWLTGYALW